MFVTLDDGFKKLIHPFSISNSPTEKGYLELTTRLRNTEFKNRLRKLKLGDTVVVNGPFGNFTLKDNESPVAMIAGGIGIPPFRSMIKYCTDMNSNTKITLLYGCRSQADIIFKDELDEMQKTNHNLKVAYTVTHAEPDYKGLTGYIDAAMIKREISEYLSKAFYICGPPDMTQTVVDLLFKIGVEKEKIRTENFGYDFERIKR